MPVRNDIKAATHAREGWPGPKDHQNKMDKFLSAFGVMYVIVKSQKDKGRALRKHILKTSYHVDLMQKLKILQAVSRPFSLQMKKNVKPINKSLKGKMLQLHCLMTI